MVCLCTNVCKHVRGFFRESFTSSDFARLTACMSGIRDQTGSSITISIMSLSPATQEINSLDESQGLGAQRPSSRLYAIKGQLTELHCCPSMDRMKDRLSRLPSGHVGGLGLWVYVCKTGRGRRRERQGKKMCRLLLVYTEIIDYSAVGRMKPSQNLNCQPFIDWKNIFSLTSDHQTFR